MNALRELSRPVDPPRAGLLLRVLPPGLYAGRARMLVVRSALASRSIWLAIVSGFFEPLFFLLAMGQGLGSLVGAVVGPAGQQLSYAAFIAPGLLAASAMNGAVYDATFSFFIKLKYAKLYDAMLATPLGPVDIALGEIGWALLRGGMYSAGFLSVMLARRVDLLSVGVAGATRCAVRGLRVRGDRDRGHLVHALLAGLRSGAARGGPMFLFSATFFPLSVYAPGVRWLVQAFPLYHAVALMRGLTTGVVGWPALGHLAYFVVMAVLGLVVASRRLKILLLR